jgi:putative flippase GtrA
MNSFKAILKRRRRFIVFCLVGGSGVLVNVAVFRAVLMLWPGAEDLQTAGAGSVPTNVAGFSGWLVSVLSNFVLNDRFTFDDQIERIDGGWQKRLGRYYISATATLVLQLAVLNAALWLLTGGPFAAPLAELAASAGVIGQLFALVGAYVRTFSNLCGIALGTVVNYALSKRWVFK